MGDGIIRNVRDWDEFVRRVEKKYKVKVVNSYVGSKDGYQYLDFDDGSTFRADYIEEKDRHGFYYRLYHEFDDKRSYNKEVKDEIHRKTY